MLADNLLVTFTDSDDIHFIELDQNTAYTILPNSCETYKMQTLDRHLY